MFGNSFFLQDYQCLAWFLNLTLLMSFQDGHQIICSCFCSLQSSFLKRAVRIHKYYQNGSSFSRHVSLNLETQFCWNIFKNTLWDPSCNFLSTVCVLFCRSVGSICMLPGTSLTLTLNGLANKSIDISLVRKSVNLELNSPFNLAKAATYVLIS